LRSAVRLRVGRHTKIVTGLAVTGLLVAIVSLIVLRPGPDEMLRRADEAFRSGENQKALELLDRLEKSRKPQSLDRLLRGRVELALGHLELARDEVSRISDDDPIGPLARLLEGQVNVKCGSLRLAETAFLRAVRIQPRFPQAHRELTFIYSLQHRIPELDRELEALADLGELTPTYLLHWTKLKNANWNASKDLDELMRVVAADSSDRWSRLALADAYRHLGDFERAASVLEGFQPDDLDSIALQTRIAMEQGELEQAKGLLAGVDEGTPEVSLVRGELLSLLGESEPACAAFAIAVREFPGSRRAAAGLGRALTQLGREADAKPWLERVDRMDALGLLVAQATALERASDPEIRVKIGLACRDLGRVPEAKAWLQAAIALDPLHREAQASLAVLEHARGAKESAGLQ
jgi:tetratricopeptide (TPR) repeat protein